MSKKKNNYTFDFIEVIAFIIKWRKPLAILTLISVVLSVIFSGPYFITPLFKSTALFYPSTTNSISSTVFYAVKNEAKDPLKFGDEEITEEYLQMVESPVLKAKVISKFDLMNHYKISDSRSDKYTALYRAYDKKIKVKRTEYKSIEVAVSDADPQVAADIANYVLQMVDTVRKEIQGRMARQIFTIVEEQYFRKIAYVDSIKLRMKEIGIKGIYLGIKGIYNTPQFKPDMLNKSDKSDLGENGAEYIALEEQMNFEIEQLTILKLKYEQTKVDLEARKSNIFVINYASPSEGKSYPIRSLIVLISVISTLIMSTIVILVIEKYNEYQKTIGSF